MQLNDFNNIQKKLIESVEGSGSGFKDPDESGNPINESLKALAEHVKKQVPLCDSLFRYQSEAYFDTFKYAKQLREAGSLPELDWESEEMLGTDIGESVELKGVGRVWLDVPYLNESDDDDEEVTCDYCHGAEWDPDGPQEDDNYDDCPKCSATGKILKRDLGGSLTSEAINYASPDPKPEQDIVDKFAGVSDKLRSYYINKWAEEKGINTDDAMFKAGYIKDGYIGAGAWNWRYVGMDESVGESVSDMDKKSYLELLPRLHDEYVKSGKYNAFELPGILRQVAPELDKREAAEIVGEFFRTFSEGVNEDVTYDEELVKMLAKFEDECAHYYGYYGDTDMITIDKLLKAGKAEEAAEEMAGAMSDSSGGSKDFDNIYYFAKDQVEDYLHSINENRGLRNKVGAAALTTMLGLGGLGALDNKLDKQAYSASKQLPQLELYLDKAEEQNDQRMIKQLKQRINNHKMRLELGKGDVLGRNGQPIEVVYDKEQQATLPEAEYQGKKVQLNKPKRGGSKKYYVYVKTPKGNVKKISFGDVTGLKTKANNKKAAKSFAARHNCEKKNDKQKAGYWACRLPRYGLVKGGTWW